MKFIKWLLIVLLVLLVLAFGSVYVLVTFYKKELTQMLKEELKSRHNTILECGAVSVSFIDNWPHASVELKDVEVRSSLSAPGMAPPLHAGSIGVAFDLVKLWKGEFVAKYLSLRNAEILLEKDVDGQRNFIFTRQDTVPVQVTVPATAAPENPIQMELREVNLRNVHFVFHNAQREQQVDLTLKKADLKLRNFADGIRVLLKGHADSKGLMFNRRRGSFLENARAELDLDVVYMKNNRKLCVFPGSEIKINQQDYEVSAIAAFGEEKRFALSVKTSQVELQKIMQLVSAPVRATLSNFDVKKPLNAKLTLVGAIAKREEPAFVIQFSSRGQQLTIGKSKIPYSELDFSGRVVSLDSSRTRGDISRAYVLVSPLRGKVYRHPFTAKVLVSNLADPQIAINAMLQIRAENIDFKVARDFILQGRATAELSYEGPTTKLNSLEFLDKPMKLKSKLRFYDFSYREFNRPYTYVLNGLAQLNNRDLFFDSLRLRTVVGDAKLKGRADNFMPYVLGYSAGFRANLAASSEFIDMNPVLMKSARPAGGSVARSQKPAQKSVQSRMQDAVNVVPGKFEFNIQLFARKMVLRQMQATYVSADLNYRTDLLTIKSLHLNTCEGKLHASGSIQEFTRVKADVRVENVNVKTLFEQCENFGQEAVKSENLRGVLSLDARFRGELDDKMEVMGETMSADVKLRLRDGHLVEFPPLQKMSNLVFRNRDFNDVQFSELSENFELEGYKMNIHELEIASNVLNLYVVDGLYDFKGTSNINVLVPWSNLKRRGKNYVPKNSGESAQNVRGLKLNFQGTKNNMKVSFGHQDLPH